MEHSSDHTLHLAPQMCFWVDQYYHFSTKLEAPVLYSFVFPALVSTYSKSQGMFDDDVGDTANAVACRHCLLVHRHVPPTQAPSTMFPVFLNIYPPFLLLPVSLSLTPPGFAPHCSASFAAPLPPGYQIVSVQLQDWLLLVLT